MQAERTIFSLVKFETLRNLRCDVRRRRDSIKFVSFYAAGKKWWTINYVVSIEIIN